MTEAHETTSDLSVEQPDATGRRARSPADGASIRGVTDCAGRSSQSSPSACVRRCLVGPCRRPGAAGPWPSLQLSDPGQTPATDAQLRQKPPSPCPSHRRKTLSHTQQPQRSAFGQARYHWQNCAVTAQPARSDLRRAEAVALVGLDRAQG